MAQRSPYDIATICSWLRRRGGCRLDAVLKDRGAPIVPILSVQEDSVRVEVEGGGIEALRVRAGAGHAALQRLRQAGLGRKGAVELEVVDQLLLTRMLITLYIFTDELEPYPNRYCLPFKMKVRITARRLQPKVLALKHGISNQLGVIIGSNNEPEL